MKTLIIGMGEVGKALYEILSPHYEVFTKDIDDVDVPSGIDIMHVCIRYSPDFLGVVRGYAERYSPGVIDVCSTVPPGTCEQIGPDAVHSTTRGLHPNLADGLKNIVKHVAGPKSEKVARYFSKAGVRCITHQRARTTELAHFLNNLSYGVSLMFADEMSRICRHYGVDYYEAVMQYTATNNEGFERLDHKTKRRMILTPPNGRIGGHCLTQNAEILGPILREAGVNAPMIEMLEKFNGTGS